MTVAFSTRMAYVQKIIITVLPYLTDFKIILPNTFLLSLIVENIYNLE